MGKGSSGGGDTQVVQVPREQIPNEALLQSAGLWRTHASSPYYSSPYRTVDFAQNYTSPMMQLPTFTNSAAYQPYGLNTMQQPMNYSGAQGALASQVNSMLQPSAGVRPTGKGNMGTGLGNKGSLIASTAGAQQPPQPMPQSATSQPAAQSEADLGRRKPQEGGA